jgi:mannose-6-phosphate isomerase-like protein (cupin superfamily)
MEGLEILAYEGEGYNRTMHFGEWRVALANFGAPFDRDRYTYLERHLLTDEVFVLLSGKADLVIGLERTETPMEAGKLYNVKQGTWHALLMSEDAKVLIVENHNTSIENSEHYPII